MTAKIVSFWKKFMKQDLLFRIAICIEIIILIAMAVSAIITPKHSVEVALDTFNIEETPNITFDNSVLYFEKDPNCTENTITAPLKSQLSLPSGAYNITAQYKSAVSSQQKISNYAVQLKITSHTSDKIYADSLELDDGHSSVTRPMWVPISTDLNSLNITVSYNNKTGSQFELYSIQIEEMQIYRFVRIVAFALLFALFDFFLYIFFNKNSKRNKFISLALILGTIAIISSIPVLMDKLILGHDIKFHIVRIASVAAELKNGQFPVRMMSEMCNGYGYANSLFYCDIFLYFPAILYNMAMPLQTCYSIYAVSVNLVTAAVAYYAFSRIANSRRAGILGAILYTLSTYRLINLHVRAAVGEYTAMVFLPLIILGMYRIYTSDRPKCKDWLPLALGMSGVILCHILSVEMISVFLILFCIVYIPKTLNIRRLLAILKAAGLTLALTAWFIVPFLESYTSMDTAVSDSNIQWIQAKGINLLHLFCNYDHDLMYYDGSSTHGILTVGLSILVGIAIMLLYLYERVKWKDAPDHKQSKAVSPLLCFGILGIAFSLVYFPWSKIQSTLLSLPGSIGDTLARLIGSIQFTWRFLAIATALVVAGTVIALALLKKYNPKIEKIVSAVLLLSVVFSVFSFYLDLTDFKPNLPFKSDSNIDNMTVMGGEYYLSQTNSGALYSAIPQTIEGTAEITAYSNQNGIFVTCKNLGSNTALIDIPVFAYDHYHAYDRATGTELSISESPNNNRIAITLPSNYDGTVQVKYQPPILWRVCEIISGLTVLLLVALAFPQVRRRLRPMLRTITLTLSHPKKEGENRE